MFKPKFRARALESKLELVRLSPTGHFQRRFTIISL